MFGRFVSGSLQSDQVRLLILLFAVVVAVVAATTDPGTSADIVLAALAVGAFAVWAFIPALPLWALSLGVVAPIVVAQRDGQLEPLLFEVSLLAFVVGRWSRSRATAVVLGLVAAGAPIAVSAIQDPAEIAVGIWILGIAFPWALGVAAARQSRLTTELEATRHELARQTLLEERRRIARDVHDLVGHGLAGVLLQVTSARHVLRRDPTAAEEALRSAEEVGRLSMRELRGTVALLRSDESGVSPPVPSASDIPGLVEQARVGGLTVELRERGDVAQIAPGVGVALYRIAQEALANAARHAPQARTVLALEVTDGRVSLIADTTGPTAAVPPTERQGAHYGLTGMRERASALGGEFFAGPTAAGWRVSCRIPLEPNGADEKAPR